MMIKQAVIQGSPLRIAWGVGQQNLAEPREKQQLRTVGEETVKSP